MVVATTSVFSTVLALAAATEEYTSNNVVYDITWEDKGDMPLAVSDASASVVNGKVYLIGGCDSEFGNTKAGEHYTCLDLAKHVLVYTPQTDSWSESQASMQVERFRHSAVVVGTDIFVIGGRDKDDNLMQSVLKYSTTADEWQLVAEFSGSTSDAAGFEADGKVVVCGGYNAAYEAQASCHVMDPAADTIEFTAWTPLKHKRGDFSIVKHADFAYAYGGFTSDGWVPLTSLERIHISAAANWDTWQVQDAAMNQGRGDFAAAVLHDRLLAIGGENGDSDDIMVAGASTRFVEAYNVATGEWLGEAHLMAIPHENFRFAGATVGESVYIFGGQSPYDTNCDCYPTKSTVFVYNEQVTPVKDEQKSGTGSASSTSTAELGNSTDMAVSASLSSALVLTMLAL